jgi:hypothetical protein
MALKIMPHGRLQEWVAEAHQIFPGPPRTPAGYDEAALVLPGGGQPIGPFPGQVGRFLGQVRGLRQRHEVMNR